ncbi:OmpA family protein [Pedobacter sp. KR3-3]|uniref:OmpA family protein n=1 Tax=Pedobacter albus TaxID=3113905 RepID=A0ABU7I433_9SPHI|nr:OmpA family protein [Pedobacter sp. KR3-3]MEE1944149.1 OmpA family protein [Pedobacter sp. KR3-3]
MNKYLILFLCCLMALGAKAQNSAVKKAQNSFDDAQQYLRQNIYDEGIKYLEEAVKADPKFQLAYIQLGDVYRRMKNHEKAKENYTKAVASAPTVEARIYYVLGESELLTGDYANAKKHFESYRQQYTGDDQDLVKKATKYIADCDFAVVAIKNPEKYEPINMGFYINSANRDYFPALTADGQTIIFTRVVDGNEDFYVSTKKNNEWQKAQPLSNNINTPNYNEGAQSISPDGKYLFFTGCNRPDGMGRCDIYVSRKEGNDWGKAINLGKVINSEYWESQPSISPDGSTLYFVSNRPGGLGGYDIWKSTLTDEGQWTEPVNLGPNINTPYDENTPFMHADGKTLYFSSDGWPGLGNKDIFYSRMNKQGEFAKPINLGYPINTFNEEIGLIVTADGTEGLFSSNIANGGFGDLDIYHFKMPEKYKPLPVTYVKGIVKDKETKQLLEANVMVIDLKTNNAMFNDFTSSETGDFLAVMPIGSDYSFNVEANGYLFYSQHFELKPANTNKPYEVEILMDKIKVGGEVTMHNIFFDTNKYELLPASMVELNLLTELLKNNENVAIEIQGHTDNVGDAKMNEKLSENRAKAVYDFLVKNGIAAKRLTFKGYGETKPRFDNSTEEGRQQNRRTEFRITKS